MRNNLSKIRKAAALLWLLFINVWSLTAQSSAIAVGADQHSRWIQLVDGKKIALVVNHTVTTQGQHLLDFLLTQGQDVRLVFAPEHGFRGEAEAGADIKDGKDSKTGIPVISLYGAKKKPDMADLSEIEVVVFDIQDVGARFYTYISTLHYVMEACAEAYLPLLVLDRPNPNGHYIDGPLLDTAFRSFVGMHPIPVVHGMTIGEYACMINGERWLANGVKCNLEVIPVLGYHHQMFYDLPIPPSPNLPDMRSIYLYPSICFFEGTPVSLGRGTDKPFQRVGAPWFKGGGASFTPKSIPGKAAKPPFMDVKCFGYDYSQHPIKELQNKSQLDLQSLLDFYKQSPDKTKFFNPFFDKLAGSRTLREQISAGKTEAEIRASWASGLAAFAKVRNKYLLYPDTHTQTR